MSSISPEEQNQAVGEEGKGKGRREGKKEEGMGKGREEGRKKQIKMKK